MSLPGIVALVTVHLPIADTIKLGIVLNIANEAPEIGWVHMSRHRPTSLARACAL